MSVIYYDRPEEIKLEISVRAVRSDGTAIDLPTNIGSDILTHGSVSGKVMEMLAPHVYDGQLSEPSTKQPIGYDFVSTHAGKKIESKALTKKLTTCRSSYVGAGRKVQESDIEVIKEHTRQIDYIFSDVSRLGSEGIVTMVIQPGEKVAEYSHSLGAKAAQAAFFSGENPTPITNW